MSNGAAYPVSVFYTNTVDLNQVRNLGLSDYTDGYTMAGYVLADFPLASDTVWPESFSYENHGTICFSVPVPHALGDYVIVAFDPSTK